MVKEMLIIHYLKNILLILLISIPPWTALVSNMKKKKSKKQKRFLVIAFAIYMVITIFTDNIFPTLISIIYLLYVYKNRNKSEEAYYLRPLAKKDFTFKHSNRAITITVAKERLFIIIKSLIFKVLVTAISFWFLVLLPILGFKVEEQEVVGKFLNASFGESIYLMVLMVITAPILEEFIFRHLFYRILKKRMWKVMSAILTSLLFTLLHYNIAGVVMFFSVGIYNCYLYEKHGYRAAVINHMIFNFTSLIALLYMKTFA
ncbi:CPBP family intramembrane glutamic endopeptidase [Clostridium cylindrosporum]|uniref:Abortive infection protein n=1 Tax=Clostridium cylindrosporum DSM 605 TaxID=1121307 RepID=A0A0J8DEU0_CLOCY|nr:type II CAAX endopeptidase family protein [Clostridium cylindrosporum]KMT22754.1 abortive infection protein [Clostridium cylindrosporum DSM 605]